MSKAITLTLTDTEYRNLLLLYQLGYLVKDCVTEKNQAQVLEEIDFMQKLSKQGKESGSKHVFKEEDIYSFKRELEDEMLEIFNEFRGYVAGGM